MHRYCLLAAQFITTQLAIICGVQTPINYAMANDSQGPAQQMEPAERPSADSRLIKLDSVKKTPANEFRLSLEVNLPKGYHLNPAAKSQVSYWIEELHTAKLKTPFTNPHQVVFVPSPLNLMSFTVRLDLTLFYCREDGKGSCLIDTISFSQPVELGEASNPDNEIHLPVTIS